MPPPSPNTLLNTLFKSIPAILASMVLGVGAVHGKTTVSGTISENVTWNPAGSPYEVANTTVAAHVTVTVEPGTVVQFLDFATLDVHGRIVAAGSAAQKILFTSLSGPLEGSPWRALRLTNGDGAGNNLGASQFAHCIFEGGGNWYNCMLDVRNGSEISIDHCVFQHSRRDGIHFVANSTGPISNTRFENNAGYAILLQGSSPDVTGCHFSGNGNVARLESHAGKGSFPAFVNTTFGGDGRVHIADHMATGGTLTAAPYFIDGNRVATANETITIDGGASFHMADYATWTINGNLLALGTEDAPILFTSASGATEGAPWRAIQLTNGNGEGNGLPGSRLSYCTFEGGGHWYNCMLDVLAASEISMDHCVFQHSIRDGIHFIANSGGPISNTRFENNAGYAILLQGSSPDVTGCHFSGNGNVARLESHAGKGSFPAFVDTTFEGDGRVHIAGHMETGGRLTAAPYFIDGHRVATANETITIEGGASFHMADYATWTINGNLLALGTKEAPILFTSASGVTEGGPWRAIQLTNGNGEGNGLPGSRLSYCTFEGGGHWYNCMLDVLAGSEISMDHCVFQHSIRDGIHFLANSDGPISNTRFENNAGYALLLQGSSPEVTGCHFSGNGNIARLESHAGEGSFPAFVDTTFEGNGRVHIATHIDSGGTLTAAPYFIDGHRVATANETIAIEGGASFHMAEWATWTINGNLLALGTEAAPILFTSASGATQGNPWRAIRLTNGNGEGNGLPGSRLSYCTFEGGGDWYSCMLDVLAGSEISMDHCVFQHSRRDGIHFIANSGGPISNTRFENNAGYAIRLQGSSPDVTGCHFSGNGNVARLESHSGKGSFPGFVNTTFEGSGRVHIADHMATGGTLTAAPYFIDGSPVATANETITIEGGASFHMADWATWTINGNLLALGTEAAPILFTSASGATEGSPWRAIRLTNGNGAGNGLPGSRLSYCTFEGGGNWYACMLEATGGAPVTLDHCTFRHSVNDGVRFLGGAGGAISACTFQNIASYGLRLEGISPVITASTFENCGAQAILLLGNPTTGSSYPVFSQNTFDPDNYIEIGSHFFTDGHLSNPGQAYFVTGTRNVLPGVRTSIAPGTTLEFADRTAMVIQGALHAKGTQMDPVTFTSDDEAKARGQWRALVFNAERTQPSILQHCQIEAGGDWYGSSVDISGTQPVTIEQCFLRQGLGDGIRIVNNAPASIHLSSISGFAGHGVSISNATADIHSCDIHENDVSGVYTINATGQVVDSLVRDNKRYGVWASGNRVPSVSDCYISGNVERGIHNQASGGVELFAINNWWGDPTGPHHPNLNPEGKGDAVSDRVIFQPYRIFASNVPQELAATLENGVPVAGAFTRGVSGYYYAVDVPAGQNLTLTVDDDNNTGTTHVYLSRNRYPTPSDYEARHDANAADQRVFVSGAGPGRWYAFVFQFTAEASSAFTIRADMADIAIQRVSPQRHANTVPITMTIEGAGFIPGTSIDLISQAHSVAASEVDVESFTQINVMFDALAVPPGVYDVRVSAPGKEPAVLPMAFTAVDGGQGKLVTRLIVPGAVGYHQVATVYVEYANEGDATMAAPILLLDAEQTGRHGALLTLDRRYVTGGFWTSAIPEGFHNTIQFLASGAQAGVLQPGESMRVPVYYAGWQKPWDFSYPPIQFSLGQLTPDSSAPINWNSLRQGVQPDGMPDDLFNALWENVQTTIGNTWGQYVAAIADNAAYLESIGQRTDDVTELLAFELQQADFVDTTIPLSGGIDMLVEAPGWPLIFSRQFFHGVSGRYRSGLLGRGWVTPWETSLSERPDGTVLLESGPRRRIFQPDVRGGYLSSPGDPSKLVKQAGGFLLEESSGETSMFHTDGRLAYIENRNGVRIECEYTGNQLTALTHTEGMRLTMAYLPNGRLGAVSNTNFGSVTFAYDNTGQYLLSVTYPEGNQSLYTYETASTSLPKRHALLSASMAGKSHFFAYDARGRLGSYHKGDPQLAYSYMYSDTGNIDITDPAGNVTRMAMSGNGQVAGIRDGEGYTTTFGYDAVHQGITSVTSPAGQRLEFLYGQDGNLETVRTQDGATTKIKSNEEGTILAIEDALGNRTQYSQDASGNVSQLHRADGSSDAFTYNSMGDLIQWTNRKGQSIALQRDANGRIVRSGTDDDQELFTYDARGNLISAENSQGKITIEYAGGYLPSKVILPGGRFVEYEYDTHGRRTAVKDQTGRGTFYQYDNLGRLHRSLDEKGRLISAYEFNRIGMLSRRELSSGTVTTYDYNRAGQLVHILTRNSDGTVLQECTYERNASGFPVSAMTPEGQWTYEYDVAGQLTAARFQSASANIPDMDLRYRYDAMGNRTETRVNGAVSGYTSNSMHQYTGAGGARLDYDADGNLIEEEGSGRDREYTYDAQGRLLAVRDGDDVREYLYDALGHRIASVHNGVRTDYLIDIFRGGNVLAEFAPGNVLSSRYHYARGMESREGADGTPHFFTFDGEGSVASLLDQAGNSLNRYRYLPFGTSLVKEETVANPYQFAGRTGTRADGEGLFWMHARFYRSDLGRFLSEDTYFEPWHNPYTYALNNPLAYHDPTGEAPRPILTTQTEEELEFGYWRDWFNNGEGKKLAAQAVADYSWSVGEYFVKGGIVAGGVYLVAASNPVGWVAIVGVAGWEAYSTWSSGTATRKMINDIFKDRDRKKALQFFEKLKDLHPEYYQDLVGGQDLEKLLKDNPAEFIKMFHQAYQELAQSRDPNQKLGPAGVGENHYVAPGALLPYRVDFENDPEASAPAQVVMISDPLSDHLDWSTLEFTEVGFGDHLIAIPGSSQSFEGVQRMRYEGVELEVAIRIALDPVSGVISAVFSTTDTASGLPPEVQYGFLPPEDETGRGQGYFTYTILAKGDLPTGTEIRNVATITFDFAEVINTNQVDPHDPSKGTDPEKEALVTIDAAAPTSRVETLPVTSNASFTVQWSGEDAGSGIGLYTIYVKADNGPYEPWLENTTEASGTFTGLNNVTYQFYAIARDLVGNEELPKSAAEASTTVSDQGANLAYERWLEEYFTPTEIAAGSITAPDADPDGDGRPNRDEFAFVTDPRARDSLSLIAFRSGNRFVMRHWRRASGLTYRIERSNNLIHWQAETNVTETVLQTSGELQHVEVAVPLEGNQVRFVRVRAQ